MPNAEGDEVLQNVIGWNICALEAVKHTFCSVWGSSNYHTHHCIIDAYADVAQVCTVLVAEQVITFKAGRGGLAGQSVHYLPNLWCQGLEMVSYVAPLREYKLKARGCWTNNMVVDWGNEPLDTLEGKVGIMENAGDKKH